MLNCKQHSFDHKFFRKTAFDFLGAGVIKFETTRGFFQLLKGLFLHLYLLIYLLSIYYDLMPTKNKNKL